GGARGRNGECIAAMVRNAWAGSRTVSAETLEVVSTRRERCVEVERCNGASRSLPEPLSPRDHHDRPVVPLDESRGDDPDDAFMPILAPQHVCATPLLRLRPLIDLLNRGAQDAVLDRLPVAVQTLRTVGERARLLSVLGEQQLERD